MPEPRRILHVSTAFAVDFPGGITNYVRTLAASQVADGATVGVLDGGRLEGWTRHDGGYLVRGEPAARVAHFSLASPDLPGPSSAFLAVIRDFRPDVVHFHLTIGLGVDFYRAFASAGIPYVVSLHDYFLFCPRVTMMDFRNTDCGGPEPAKCERCIGALDQVDLLRRGARKVDLRLPRVPSKAITRRNAVVAEFLRVADAVLAVSSRVAELFRRVYPDARYRVSHIGSASATAERRPKTHSPVLRLTALGTLSKYKGAEVLAALARRLPKDRVAVRFFGRVDEARWGRLAARSGVDLRGAYTPSELPDILADTDLGLMLPVWEDNAPQVVMEFLNHGTPVLATRMGGIPDFVNESNGFLVDHTTEVGLDEAARFVVGLTPARAQEWGASFGRLSTPEAHRTELASIYASALAR